MSSISSPGDIATVPLARASSTIASKRSAIAVRAGDIANVVADVAVTAVRRLCSTSPSFVGERDVMRPSEVPWHQSSALGKSLPN